MQEREKNEQIQNRKNENGTSKCRNETTKKEEANVEMKEQKRMSECRNKRTKKMSECRNERTKKNERMWERKNKRMQK